MSKIGMTDVKASGMVRIIDKDGKVKAELEITSASVNEAALKQKRKQENATVKHRKG